MKAIARLVAGGNNIPRLKRSFCEAFPAKSEGVSKPSKVRSSNFMRTRIVICFPGEVQLVEDMISKQEVEKLQEPLSVFNQKDSGSEEEQKERIKLLISKKKINEAEVLATTSDTLFDFMIEEMSTNDNAKRASELVEKHNKDPKKYPNLILRLKKKAVRWLLTQLSWEFLELKLKGRPDCLAMAAEDYFFKGKKDVAYTLVRRNKLVPLLTKVELNEWLKTNPEESGEAKLLENMILKNDTFGPCPQGKDSADKNSIEEKENYLTLEEFGITEKNVQMVKNPMEFMQMMQHIKKCKQISIDTEMVPRIQKFDSDKPSLIQIATPDKIFLIDLVVGEMFGFPKQHTLSLLKEFSNLNEVLVIGQNLALDMKLLKTYFNITDNFVSGLI